jgi:PAS domain S-box-containing protein
VYVSRVASPSDSIPDELAESKLRTCVSNPYTYRKLQPPVDALRISFIHGFRVHPRLPTWYRLGRFGQSCRDYLEVVPRCDYADRDHHYLPHGFCYLWNKQLLTLHIIADSTIFLSYLSIAGSLAWIAHKYKQHIQFALLFFAFGTFILACGFSHALDVINLWKPFYWLSADIKLITAIASVTTAVALPSLFPKLRSVLNAAASSELNASRFLAISESSNDGFYLLESVREAAGDIVDFRFSFLNDKGARLISSTPESMQGQLLCVRLPVNRTNGLFEEYKIVVETGKRLDIVTPFDVEGVNATWLHLQAMKVGDGIAVTTQNMSGLKEGERRLAETSARYRFLIEGVTDHAIFTIDADGLVTSWNRGARRLFGYADADIIGQNVSCLMTTEDVQKGLSQNLLDRAMQQGRAEDEGWRLSNDGTQFYANVNIATMLEDPSNCFGFAVVVQDMTERRSVAIAQQVIQEERTLLRERFLSHVSHELRTPLTAAYFFAGNMLDGICGDLNPEQHEHLSLTIENLDQLKNMVSDLLDVTRSETHKLAIEQQHLSAVVTANEALSTCRGNAAAANVHLVSLVPLDLPFLSADPIRVRQILINLVDNAIKFTPPGGTVSLGCSLCPEDSRFLCFSVADTGCGISPENLELVFDRLAQIENNLVASRSGLGLGLHISKELVIQHGGRIWVESQVGQGSTFFFTLPVFSLEKICASILTSPDPTASAALITIDLASVNGVADPEALAGIRKILESCIRQDQDVLLPSMCEGGREDIFFIVASTPPGRLGAVRQRINEKLRTSYILGELKPLITVGMLPVECGQLKGRQESTISADVERALQQHSQKKGYLR